MMTKPDLRQQISQILVRWCMPTRQAAINEIMIAIDHWVDEVIGDPCPSCHNNEQDNPNNWCERYAFWVEQRQRAGINVQTNQRKGVKN